MYDFYLKFINHKIVYVGRFPFSILADSGAGASCADRKKRECHGVELLVSDAHCPASRHSLPSPEPACARLHCHSVCFHGVCTVQLIAWVVPMAPSSAVAMATMTFRMVFHPFSLSLLMLSFLFPFCLFQYITTVVRISRRCRSRCLCRHRSWAAPPPCTRRGKSLCAVRRHLCAVRAGTARACPSRCWRR